jgi:hypothetical protein
MKICKLLSIISLLFFILLQPLTIYACGGFETFTPVKQTSHSSDETKVFVKVINGKEIYVVQPDFTGDAKQFGAVLPFPAKPIIKEAPEAFFEELALIFNPPSRMVFGAAPPTSGGGDSVQVVEKKDVGDFETTTLTATSASDLIAWLKNNNYTYSEKDLGNFDYYVQKGGYYFVALKIKLSTFNGSLRPIAFMFDSDVPVVAMRISASDMKPMKYTLYTAGDEMTFVPGTLILGSKKVVKSDVNGVSEFSGYLEEGNWLTQAEVTMNPGTILEDLVLSEATNPEPVSGKVVILNAQSVPKDAGIVLGTSTAVKKTIAVVKVSPTVTVAPTSTPTPVMEHNEDTTPTKAPAPHKYLGTIFLIIVVGGLAIEVAVGYILYKLLRRK